MIKYGVVICAFAFANFAFAAAPFIPKLFQGTWTESAPTKENCEGGPESSALFITKDEILAGESGCKIIRVTNEGAGVKVISKCSAEGEYYDDIVTLNILDGKLKAHNQNWHKKTQLLNKCK